MSWRISFYSAKLEQEILQLPPPFVGRFVRYAERMETFGPISKTPPKELGIARRRMREVKREIN